jgi:hypothetical protein
MSRERCRGGAWGSPDSCIPHEGKPIDPQTGYCADGEPLPGEQERWSAAGRKSWQTRRARQAQLALNLAPTETGDRS